MSLNELKFFYKNPRVYSTVHSTFGSEPTQDEIFRVMKLQRTLTPISPKPQKNDVKDTDSKQQTGSFSETLNNSMEEVNQLQKEADKAIEALATGETKDISQTMIAIEKANVSFQLMTQVRNRLVEAYQEVLRMQS